MPFDGMQTGPSLTALSAILRDRSRWPPGFVWNYDHCETCAVGMAGKLWFAQNNFDASDAMLAFSMSPTAVYSIFCHIGNRRSGEEGRYVSDFVVMPEHVADALDEYMAKAPALVSQAA